MLHFHFPRLRFPDLSWIAAPFTARARIRELEAELARVRHDLAIESARPSFTQAARGFDASFITQETKHIVMHDLRPVLSRVAIDCVSAALRDLAGKQTLTGRIAVQDDDSNVARIDFHFPARTITVHQMLPPHPLHQIRGHPLEPAPPMAPEGD